MGLISVLTARTGNSACRQFDLDGPLLQKHDRVPPIPFLGGLMGLPPRELWG
jgi:hypothetical protein